MLDPKTLSSLKVTELKAELKKRGLPVGGLKQVLVERLADFLVRERDQLRAEQGAVNAQKKEGGPQEVRNGDVNALLAEPPREPMPKRVPEPEPEPEPEPSRDPEPDRIAQAAGVAERVDPTPEGEEAAKGANEIATETKLESEPTAQATLPEVVEKQAVPELVVPVLEKSEPTALESENAASEPEIPPPGPDPEPKRASPGPEKAVPEPELSAGSEESAVGEGTPAREELVSSPQEIDGGEGEQATVTPKVEDHPLGEENGDLDMSDAPPPAEATTVGGPVAPGSSSDQEPKPEPETEPEAQPTPVDPMDTHEDVANDIRKRKRRSPTPTPQAIRDSATEEQAEIPPKSEDEGSAPKKPRQEDTASPNAPQRSRQKDPRFKGLFAGGDAPQSSTLPTQFPMELMADQSQNEQDDAPVAPSIHPATRALYIRDLTRPLQEHTLRSHIITLASHPSNPSSEDPIQSFYLDPIKSHALIVFQSLTTATRVRVGIHGKIWPNERTRRPLWVDFIPEERVAGWVERERQRPGRWEVVYIPDTDEDGGIRVELKEVGASGRNPSGVEVFGAPTGPKGERRDSIVPKPSSSSQEQGARKGRVIKDLDELFKSTKAKPKLYWMPVDPEISSRRLAAHRRRDSRGRR